MDIYPMSSKYDPSLNTIPNQLQQQSLILCTGGEDILLIQDIIPWGAPVGEIVTELNAQGKNFCMITSNQLGSTNLSKYKEIIISEAQTQQFYNNLFPGGVIHQAITDYVMNGGILSANLTDNAGWGGGSWIGYTFIGGVQHVESYDDNNNIADSNHPIITGNVPCVSGNCGQIVDIGLRNDLDGWNYSSHGFFTNLMLGATIIIVDSQNRPVMIEYSFGNGKVITNLTTIEWRYSTNFYPKNKKLLANEIAYQSLLLPSRGFEFI